MAQSDISALTSPKSKAWAILLIVFGFLAIALPFATSIGIVIVIAWLLIFSGGIQFVHAFRSHGAGSIVWKLLVAILYLVVGIGFLVHPAKGVAGFTLVLAIFLVTEGIMDLFAYFRTRSRSGSSWILIDGVVTLILGLLVWRHWPSSSAWVIGTLVGINMIMTGWTRLMVSVAARRVTTSSV